MSDDKTTTLPALDPLKWLEAIALLTGEGIFRKAADELRAARIALREIGDRAGYDRGAEWCRERARQALARDGCDPSDQPASRRDQAS